MKTIRSNEFFSSWNKKKKKGRVCQKPKIRDAMKNDFASSFVCFYGEILFFTDEKSIITLISLVLFIFHLT